MPTVFGDSTDDESENERKQKQRQNFLSIRQAAVQHQSPPPTSASHTAPLKPPADSTDFLSEENELQHLRNNPAYKQYENSSKRKRSLSPPPLASPPPASQPPASLPPVEHPSTENPAPASPAPHNAHLRTASVELSPPPPKISSSLQKKGRPRIDPKILDDSSDDDDENHNSSSDEDQLLGPSLPPAPQPKPTHPQVSITHLPIHNEATLGAHHSLQVTCLALEPSANRLITASLDMTAKLWDFNAMTRSLQPFRTLSPVPDAAPRSAHFSRTGAYLLFAADTPAAHVLDRDGRPVARTETGDMYLADAARTPGHTARVTAALWATPATSLPASALVSAAADATVRVWDLARAARPPHGKHSIIKQTSVLRVRTPRGLRAPVSAMAWGADGRQVVLGCADGRIRLADIAARACTAQSDVFASGVETTALACAASHAPPLIAARCADDMLRIFDMRMLQHPVCEFSGLLNTAGETAAMFVGGDDALVMTGTSADRRADKAASGALHLFCVRTMRQLWHGDAGAGCGSVVSMLWHDKVNQIVYGTGNGQVHVLYHDRESQRGILSCLARSEFRRKQGVVSVQVSNVLSGSDLHLSRRGRGQHGNSAGAAEVGPPKRSTGTAAKRPRQA